jgi:hypothetical protein
MTGDKMREVFSKRSIPLLLALLSALGCANVQPIAADGPLALKSNQGILAIHVDSDFPIRRLRFNTGITVARDLSRGEYVALVVVPAGSYRWTTIEVPMRNSDAYYRFRMRRDSDWRFKVEAGRINYPGQVIVKGSERTLLRSNSLYAWTKNRPALALERIRATYPSLLTQYPLANGRSERDDFLALYQKLAPFELPKAPEGSPN